MLSRIVRAFGLGLFTAALASVPLLAALAPADAVRARKDGFHQLGVASKNLRDELNNGSPNAVVLQMAARDIGNAAKAMPGWFPKGSGPLPGVKTRAKAEIWTKAAEFKAAQNAFVAQTAVFMKAAASGDVALIRAEHRKLARTCTTCHDTFRGD